MKRTNILSLLLTAALLVSPLPSALAADTGALESAAEEQRGDAPLTVGELLSALFLWEGDPVTDVAQRGVELGLWGGASSASPLPLGDTVSRGDTAGIIMSYCLATGFLPQASKPLSFVDGAALRADQVGALEFCNAYGLFRGVGNDVLAPLRAITRLEWEILLGRMTEAKHALDQSDPARAYAAAVADAVTVEPEELLPLKTSITKTHPNVTWNEAGDRVLVLTWNSQPEVYVSGARCTVDDGGVWVFTPKEFTNWYTEHTAPITDLDLRLEQLIGLPPGAGYTTMTALWVAPEEMVRPAYESDITSATMTTTLTGPTPFQDWFRGNAATTYGENPYPWTRLGYTYDWADNGTEYGLTEFLITPGSEVEVAFSSATQDFFAQLDRQLQTSGSNP